VINDHVYVLFSRTHFTRAIYWYTTIMYTCIIIICTRRWNARPVNINHIVIRSTTIIRSAAALLHGRRRLWSVTWKIISNVFQPTYGRWKTENSLPPLPTTAARRRRVFACLRHHTSTAANHTIYDVHLQIWGRIFVFIIRTTLYAPFFTCVILFSVLPTAAPHRFCNNINYKKIVLSPWPVSILIALGIEKEKIMFF